MQVADLDSDRCRPCDDDVAFGGSSHDFAVRLSSPSDVASLQSAHLQLFPVDYPPDFFEDVCRNRHPFFSVCSVQDDGTMSGFATAKVCALSQASPNDAAAIIHQLHANVHAADNVTTAYLLTLGVLPDFQRRGLASKLLQQVVQRAEGLGAAVLWLHAATYNTAACQFYAKHGFSRLRRHLNFYTFNLQRAPDPTQTHYDAYLMALTLLNSSHGAFDASIAGGDPPMTVLQRTQAGLLALAQMLPGRRCLGWEGREGFTSGWTPVGELGDLEEELLLEEHGGEKGRGKQEAHDVRLKPACTVSTLGALSRRNVRGERVEVPAPSCDDVYQDTSLGWFRALFAQHRP